MVSCVPDDAQPQVYVTYDHPVDAGVLAAADFTLPTTLPANGVWQYDATTIGLGFDVPVEHGSAISYAGAAPGFMSPDSVPVT